MNNFLATDKVPETVFGIPIVTDGYTEEDLAFFAEHPEAGGYYSMGEEDDTEERGALKAGNAEDELVGRINTAISQVIPFIKEHEGFRDRAYRDTKGQWAIGYGQSEIDGRPVRKGDVIDEKAASEFVERRVRQNAADIQRTTSWTNNASANALSALYDLAYNMGVGILSEEKSPTLNRTGRTAVGTNAVDAAIWAQVPTYTRADGKVLEGLRNRRNDAIRAWKK